MDRPHAAVARSATPQWLAHAVLECTGRRWRDDAETAWRGEISRVVSDSAIRGIVRPKRDRKVPFESVGDHPAWKFATGHVILRPCGSHSATIVIGSENIHAGTGLSGIILEPDRDKAEAAAKEAIERLRRMPPSIRVERSAGAVGHNDAAGQAGS